MTTGWVDTSVKGFVPTADMVNHRDPIIRASQVANLANLLRHVLAFLDEMRTAGGIPEAVELSDATPNPVADASSAGSSEEASRSDHVHAGVASVSKTALARGDIIFSGDGVTQAGNTFTIPGAPDWDYNFTGVATADPMIWTLPDTYDEDTVVLLLDHLILIPGVDFTVVGATLTFLGAWDPSRTWVILQARIS